MRIIAPNNPHSWFTEIGRYKILKDLKPKLPDARGKLFLTLTVDPKKFDSEEKAFEDSRDRIRKMMYDLRNGIKHDGKNFKINAPYFVKVEFHKSGYAHFHLIVMTRRYIPGALLNRLWGIGRTNVKRIRNKTFHYLLKYVTKNCEIPEWVMNRTCIRIIQPSRDFYIKSEEERRNQMMQNQRVIMLKKPMIQEKKKPRKTIGERLHDWKCSGIIEHTLDDGRITRWTVNLSAPYWDIIHEHVWEMALKGEYFGEGRAIFYPGSIFKKYLI